MDATFTTYSGTSATSIKIISGRYGAGGPAAALGTARAGPQAEVSGLAPRPSPTTYGTGPSPRRTVTTPGQAVGHISTRPVGRVMI